MKCTIAIFFTVAIAACQSLSTWTNNHQILIKDEGRSIVITTTEGNTAVITRLVGLIEIIVDGPTVLSKRIQISDQIVSNKKLGGVLTQGDVLVNILRQSEGIVDQVTFERLLGQIEEAVNWGLLDVVILDGLKSLILVGNQEGSNLVSLLRGGGIGRSTVVPRQSLLLPKVGQQQLGGGVGLKQVGGLVVGGGVPLVGQQQQQGVGVYGDRGQLLWW